MGAEGGEAGGRGGGGRAGGRRFASRPLTAEETEALLERHWWGTLATAAEGEAYAVPVVYGWDGERFWTASTEGRKVEALRRNPSVCLTVVEVEDDGAYWESAVVLGRAEVVDDVRSRLTALRTLRRQRGHAGRVTPRDAARLARARLIRITPRQVTGRAKA